MLQKAGFILLVVSFLTSCSKIVKDKEDPVITNFELNSKSFEPGESLQVSLSGTDNENLAQVRIRIEQAFNKADFGFWRVVEIQDVSGQSFSQSFNFVIPDSSLAGCYSVAVQLADLRGNGSVDSVRYINITQNEIMPQLESFSTIPAANQNQVIILNEDDTLTFSGLAVGDTSLNKVEIELYSDIGSSMTRFTYNLNDSTDIWDFELYADTIFTNFSSNPEMLIIRVTDAVGHLNRTSFGVDYEP